MCSGTLADQRKCTSCQNSLITIFFFFNRVTSGMIIFGMKNVDRLLSQRTRSGLLYTSHYDGTKPWRECGQRVSFFYPYPTIYCQKPYTPLQFICKNFTSSNTTQVKNHWLKSLRNSIARYCSVINRWYITCPNTRQNVPWDTGWSKQLWPSQKYSYLDFFALTDSNNQHIIYEIP